MEPCSGPTLPQILASANAATSKHPHDEGCPNLALVSKGSKQGLAPVTFRGPSPSCKAWNKHDSQPEGQAAEDAAGKAARGAESMAKRRLEAGGGCLNAAGRGGPTFGRWCALSIRGFRAWFLRSILSGGLQGRLWNIHNEPLRTAASPHPSFRLQEEMGSGVFQT